MMLIKGYRLVSLLLFISFAAAASPKVKPVDCGSWMATGMANDWDEIEIPVAQMFSVYMYGASEETRSERVKTYLGYLQRFFDPLAPAEAGLLAGEFHAHLDAVGDLLYAREFKKAKQLLLTSRALAERAGVRLDVKRYEIYYPERLVELWNGSLPANVDHESRSVNLFEVGLAESRDAEARSRPLFEFDLSKPFLSELAAEEILIWIEELSHVEQYLREYAGLPY